MNENPLRYLQEFILSLAAPQENYTIVERHTFMKIPRLFNSNQTFQATVMRSY